LRTLFKRLKPVRAAAYDSARRQSCFGDTRAQLLSEIQRWINDRGGKHIYILYGVAGIGKSTVAKTVAEHAARDGTLGASFFFSRDEDNRKSAKSFFNTLAYSSFRNVREFSSVGIPCCYGGVCGRRSKIYMINFNTKMRTLSRCSAMAWSTVAKPPNVALRTFGIVVVPDSVGTGA